MVLVLVGSDREELDRLEVMFTEAEVVVFVVDMLLTEDPTFEELAVEVEETVDVMLLLGLLFIDGELLVGTVGTGGEGNPGMAPGTELGMPQPEAIICCGTMQRICCCIIACIAMNCANGINGAIGGTALVAGGLMLVGACDIAGL